MTELMNGCLNAHWHEKSIEVAHDLFEKMLIDYWFTFSYQNSGCLCTPARSRTMHYKINCNPLLCQIKTLLGGIIM